MLSDLKKHGPGAEIVALLHYDSNGERTSIVFRSSGGCGGRAEAGIPA